MRVNNYKEINRLTNYSVIKFVLNCDGNAIYWNLLDIRTINQ